MAKSKVYLSSTYVDLKKHRAEVIEFFGTKPLLEKFDLLRMEGYVADDVEALSQCLKDVEQCDIYILILSNRYGFIPSDVKKNPDRLSITELEYNTAFDGNKTILAFFADEKDPLFEFDNESVENLSKEKKEKLNSFKKRVRDTKLTHPEGFIAPTDLALQVAESIMARAFIAFKLEDSRKYCCDRKPQFINYLQARGKGRFKSIVIYGDRNELGLNLINRFGIFTLNLNENELVPPIGFEDFITSEDYDECKRILLGNIYDKNPHWKLLYDSPLATSLSEIKKLDGSLVIVISSDSEMFEEHHITFLQKFMNELDEACCSTESPEIYLFLNLEKNSQSDDIENKLKKLRPNNKNYLYVLPALQSLKETDIRNWLMTYVSPDQGEVLDLLDDLKIPKTLTMRDAEKKISEFIKKYKK